MMDINKDIEVMVYKFFDNKSAVISNYTRIGVNFKNQQVAEKLHQQFIRKYTQCKAYSSFIEKNWGANLVIMYLIKKCKETWFYYVLLIFLVNIHDFLFERQKSITITNAFQKKLEMSLIANSIKRCVDKGSEFYKSSMKS